MNNLTHFTCDVFQCTIVGITNTKVATIEIYSIKVSDSTQCSVRICIFNESISLRTTYQHTHITSHHITSHHITSHHITSHHGQFKGHVAHCNVVKQCVMMCNDTWCIAVYRAVECSKCFAVQFYPVICSDVL
jgi:hypothetical protein